MTRDSPNKLTRVTPMRTPSPPRSQSNSRPITPSRQSSIKNISSDKVLKPVDDSTLKKDKSDNRRKSETISVDQKYQTIFTNWETELSSFEIKYNDNIIDLLNLSLDDVDDYMKEDYRSQSYLNDLASEFDDDESDYFRLMPQQPHRSELDDS